MLDVCKDKYDLLRALRSKGVFGSSDRRFVRTKTEKNDSREVRAYVFE